MKRPIDEIRKSEVRSSQYSSKRGERNDKLINWSLSIIDPNDRET